MADEVGVEAGQKAPSDHLADQIAGGQKKPQQDRSKAGAGRDPSCRPRERDVGNAARVLCRDREVPAAAKALQRDQGSDDQQHEAGNLRRAGKASAIEPGREDRQRQRLHAEIFAGADIV